MDSIEAFPLQWPSDFERTTHKKNSRFNCTLAEARDSVLNEIRLLNGSNVIISSSIPLKRDGQMQGTGRPVDGDHGVAVYFTWKNDQYVFACDTYTYIWDNLRAIAKTIDSIRTIERHASSNLLKRAFKGFKTLPEANGIKKRKWFEVLGCTSFAHPEVIKSRYREMVKIYHPDIERTGDTQLFQEIQMAYEEANKLMNFK